ncbi:MAG: Hsp20 family protein, partial [Gammaproteobacteria bacterium]|nr:Hsp20 family protein [Gammaproteobacteria bacterium]
MPGLTRYEPWSLLDQFNNELNSLFRGRAPAVGNGELSASDWVPAVDIKEEPNQYIIHADVPGVEPKDIHVSMENGVLSIKGE